MRILETDHFKIETSDQSSGVKTWIKTRDGWSMPREWISAATASVGHAVLAKERFWEGYSHLLLSARLSRFA